MRGTWAREEARLRAGVRVCICEKHEHKKQTPLRAQVYIVMHGSIDICKGSLVLTTLTAEQGQAASTEAGLPVFGEMAMLDRKPRIAAAVVATDCKLLVLPVEQFAACMLIVPDIKARMRRMKEVRRVQNNVNDRRRATGK